MTAPPNPDQTPPPPAMPDDATIPWERRALPDFDAPTMEAATERHPHVANGPQSEQPPTRLQELRLIAKDLATRHQKKIWWLHTFYALGLGFFVATFAKEGLERARWLGVTLGFAWVLFLFFFKFFGTGARQDFVTAWPGARRRFFVMTYLLKNLLQGMLFFQLPFYWKSTTWDGPTNWFVIVMGVCAILSTLDLVFDRLLMRFKTVASAFYAVTLFGSLNIVLSALFPNLASVTKLMIAGVVTVVASWLLYVPLSSMLQKGPLAGFLASLIGAGGLVYWECDVVPPVPLHVVEGGVGPRLLETTDEEEDARLAFEVTSIHEDEFKELYARTTVSVMGTGDRLLHQWKHDGKLVHSDAEPWPREKEKRGAGNIVITSKLPEERLPSDPVGHWSVDVETESGQLVGRVSFDVRN